MNYRLASTCCYSCFTSLHAYRDCTRFAIFISYKYVPQFNMRLPDEWSLLDRAKNLLQWMKMYNLYSCELSSLYGKIKAKHNIMPDKSIQETLGRVDLVIAQIPFGLEHPRPLYPSKYFLLSSFTKYC